MARILWGILLWGVGTLVHGQTEDLSNWRTKRLPASTEWQTLDSLPVWAPSARVIDLDQNQWLDSSDYQIRLHQFRLTSPRRDSVQIQYRVLPFDPGRVLFRLDTNFINPAGSDGKVPERAYDPYADDSPLVNFQGLDYSGNFARGIAFGNSQNLVLNSSFNLQMAGTIGDGIEILAAITDENIPLQPEGNTQQINEFDRIFIQLSKDQNKLIAGDYELRNPDSYFMRYFKKLQGATFQNQSQVSETGNLRSQASVALARGKFSRNTLLGIEGNQGPYRLQGAEGERFIIILAGTERIFIDGQLLQRGLDADYVIDYNQGLLTFTNRQLITKDKRIIAEFEYNDQNYLRSIYALNTEFRQDQNRFYLNMYSEQDGRNSIGETPLSPEDRAILQAAGDDPLQAVTSGVRPAEGSANPIRYRMTDTLVNGIFYEDILIHEPDASSETALFVANFSNVGMGNGNYTQPPSDANGVVFIWVAPDANGLPQGSFEPVSRLVAPQQLQLYTAGGSIALSEKANLTGEIALSRRDNNRFSDQDAGDDDGLGLRLGYDQQHRLGERWDLKSTLDYELIHQNFRALNPYRAPEFNRDWNLGTAPTDRPEHLGRLNLQARNDSLGMQWQYTLSGFLRETSYQGLRNGLGFKWRKHGWDLDIQGDLLQASSSTDQTTFSRPKALISRTFPKLNQWRIGFYFEQERNAVLDQTGDTLQAGSFRYELYRAFIENPENEQFKFGFYLSQRDDFSPEKYRFRAVSQAREAKVEGFWKYKRASRLGYNFTYRQLEVSDTETVGTEPSDSYLGRIDYNLQLFKGALLYTNAYQIGSGQEQKILFIYREVLNGSGTYQHIDFNNDGQEQNNEFVIAPTADQGTHERIVVYTEEFIRTNTVQFNQSLRLEPKAVWFNKTGMAGFAGKFSTLSSWQISRSVRDLEGISPWNPFQLTITDTALVSTQTLLQNTLFFNRGNEVYDIRLAWNDTQAKILLTTGLESRQTEETSLKFRWNLNQTFSTLWSVSRRRRANDSENFVDRSYDIAAYALEPQLTWQPRNTFRTVLKYRYEEAVNEFPGSGETGVFHDLSLEARLNQAAKTSLEVAISLVQVAFDGEANSAAGFAFLNGLQDGRNYLWNIRLDRQLARNIRLGISYEGRKTGTAPMVHIGRAQVGATF